MGGTFAELRLRLRRHRYFHHPHPLGQRRPRRPGPHHPVLTAKARNPRIRLRSRSGPDPGTRLCRPVGHRSILLLPEPALPARREPYQQ